MRVTKWIGVALAVVTFVCGVCAAEASEVNITALYKGNVKKTAGQFTNQTQTSGVCTDHPEYCGPEVFSIILPWTNNQGKNHQVPMGWKTVTHTDPMRDHMYLSFDSNVHSVTVSNVKNGSTHSVHFRVNGMGLAWDMHAIPSGAGFDGDNCANLWQWGSDWDNVIVVSKTAGRAVCSKYFTESFKAGRRVAVTYVSMSYLLSLEKPWTWEPGVYKGTYTLTVGSGKAIDFGNNFEGSADDVKINFTLTVLPDMYVNFNTGAGGVVNTNLEPTGGWLHWQGKMPPYLSSDVPFDFGATGPVKIHLANCDHAVDDTCGIVDLQRGGSALGVDAMLTDNYVTDDSGKRALNTRLSTKERVFKPVSEGGSGSQRAHLLLRTRDGVTQQMQRGHHYGGHMTVVFDSDVNN